MNTIFVKIINAGTLIITLLCLPLQANASLATKNEIEQYISQTWQTLTRATNHCVTLRDPKVKMQQILYLPANMEVPDSLRLNCKLTIKHLPEKIIQLGKKQFTIKNHGLLYLPHPYVVPGGIFNEMYGWDSYFIIRGLIEDKKLGLAFGMLENFFFEIEHYGGVLNANRTYYLSRSQPPFLTSMIRKIYMADKDNQFTDQKWLARAYQYAIKDYHVWMSPPHLIPAIGLSRYYDFASGPVPELVHTPNYYQDITHYFLTHPEKNHGYLMARLDTKTKINSSGEYELTPHFYQGDRAMRESGFDTSFRFGAFGADTSDYVPVDLNSLLYKTEKDLAWISNQLNNPARARRFELRAEKRKGLMNTYLWDEKRGLYFDYNFVREKLSNYMYATTFYPLWAGASSSSQAARLTNNLNKFEKNGGIVMSLQPSGEQWDYPYGWAPIQLISIEGLSRYGYRDEANRIANRFLRMLSENFSHDHTLREKYDVILESSKTNIQIGYKGNMTGFGWTNGVALVLLHHYSSLKHGS